MAAPGVAVPGSVVAIGSQASPAGPQGIQGPAMVNAFVTKTAAYTLTSADSGKYFICSGGSWTLTLPAPASGLVFQVRNDMGISGTTGTITLSPTGGTIDGLASISLLPQQECTLLTDGTNWRTFGKQRAVILGTQDITSATASGTILLPSGFRYFQLDWTNLQPSVDRATLQFQISLDGGTTWQTTGYYGVLFYNSSGSALTVATDSNVASGRGSATLATSGLLSQSRIVLSQGSASAFFTYIMDSGGTDSSFGLSQFRFAGRFSAPGLVTALKYSCSSGNIVNSNLTVKGVI